MPAETAAPTRVLLVEDNRLEAQMFRDLLVEGEQPSTFVVEHVTQIGEALDWLSHDAPDLILLDLVLPDASGLDGLERIHQAAPRLPIVVLTGLTDAATKRQALQIGAHDYLTKGKMDRSFLIRSIQHVVERHRILGELADVTHRLDRLVFLDPLTELLNRRGLQRVLTREIRWAQRQGESLLAILVDLDDFKRINDTFGYTVGDVVLKEIARKVRDGLRATDYVARIGGDEFLVLLPQVRPAEAGRVAEKLRLAVSETPILLSSGERIRVTASLGVVTPSPETKSIGELLSLTHPILSRGKRTGKNRVSYERTEGEQEEGKKYELSHVLEMLHRGGQLRVVRQPILRLVDETVIGHEMLSRSTIEIFETPDTFFRVCLEAGSLPLVDRQCLKTCLAAAATLPAGDRCHVNLFPSTLIDVPVEHLLEAFPEGDRERQFCVEISEKQIIGDPSYLIETVAAFKRHGILVAIDDVGFGRSCLESLVLLEPDIVKVDRSCIHGLARDAGLRQVLGRLLTVVQSLGAEVVAEGVETAEDREALQALGVQYAQGFLWGEPCPVPAT